MVRKNGRLVIPENQAHARSSAFLLVNEAGGRGGGGGRCESVGQLGTEQTFSNNGCHFTYSFNRYLSGSYHGPWVRDYPSEDLSSNEDKQTQALPSWSWPRARFLADIVQPSPQHYNLEVTIFDFLMRIPSTRELK